MAESALIEVARAAFMQALLLSGPFLLVGLLVGVVTGVVQAITQVHDQALSFSPKLLCVLMVFAVSLPWLMERLSEFAASMFTAGPFGL